jgi:outer membrane protein
VARLSVPIYEGGAVYSRVRQAKETLGQTQINVDIQRDVVRSAVVQSLGQLEASKAQIISTQAQVRAAEIALNGVREEAKVGQRTTLDVLNAQQELINARVSFISAQRDRVVNSYNVLASVGRLDAESLRLKVGVYNPKTHYEQVKDKWIGLRTPDGR